MPNTNILEGMQCPKCKSFGPFWIAASAMFLVYDDGVDEHTDTQWGKITYCQCANCEFAATARGFGLED